MKIAFAETPYFPKDYFSSMNNGRKECCNTVREVKKSIEYGTMIVREFRCAILDQSGKTVVNAHLPCLSTRQSLEHIRDCCGCGEILDELLVGYSVEDLCKCEEHHYFFFSIALILEDSCPELLSDMWNIVPFLRFSMRARWYDPARWARGYDSERSVPLDKFGVVSYPSYQEVSGDYIKFSDGTCLSAKELLSLPNCMMMFPSCKSLFLLDTMALDIRVDDLKSVSSSGYNIPEYLVKICDSLTYPGYDEILLNILRKREIGISDSSESSEEDIDRFELLIQVDLTHIRQVDYHPSEDIREEYSEDECGNLGNYNIWPSLHVYTKDAMFPDYCEVHDDIGDFRYFHEEGYGPDEEDLIAILNKNEIYNLLNTLALAGVSIIWDGNEITLRSDRCAKSARK